MLVVGYSHQGYHFNVPIMTCS